MNKVFLFLLAACLWSGGAMAEEENPLIFVTFGDLPPYHTVDKQGEPMGFDIDLARIVSQKLGRKIEIKNISKNDVIDWVVSGKADAVMGITETKEGKAIFDFTTPYLHHKTRVFIHKGSSFITRMTDLSRMRVGVREGIDVVQYLNIIPGINPAVEPTAEVGLRNVIAHVTSAYLGDEYECDYYIQKSRMEDIETLGGAYLLRRRAIGVKKGNEELLNELNRVIGTLLKEFDIQALKDQWLVRSISMQGMNRYSLVVLLVVLIIVLGILLITLIFNQKLASAVRERTREVQSEHDHFENIFDHASDGIVVLNPLSTRVVQVNKAFEAILEYDDGELNEVELADLDATEEKNFANQVHRAVSSGENVLFETKLLTKAQDIVDLVVHAKAFPYKGVQMVEAIARDITQSKKLEAMKDTILQDVAHELKTPMAKLSMSIDLLERKIPKVEKSKYDKHFDVCRRSMIRLQSTIEGILNLSRLESNSAKGKMAVFGLQDVIRNVAQELQMFAERKRIRLAVDLPKQKIELKGDMEMMHRLFTNLIHNAIKFTDQGSVQVHLESDDQFAKIAVKDQGIGIEKDDLTKIFGRFFQKTAAIEGSGVGLTISQKIVSFHNGVIWAESEGLSKGASMNVLFPLYDPKTEQK